MLKHLMERMLGSWSGTTIYTDLTGAIIDQRATVQQLTFGADGEVRLESSVIAADGSATPSVLVGRFRHDDLAEFSVGAATLTLTSPDESSLLITGPYGEDERLIEIISVTDDGRHRSRAGMVLRNGACGKRIWMHEDRPGDA